MNTYLKQHSIILFIITLAVGCQSCKDKDFECTQGNTVSIPQIMKDYFHFKQGTWWVYVNTKNNTYDSMSVWQNSSSNNRGEGNEGFGDTDKCYEQVLSAIRNNFNKDLMNFRISNIITNERKRFRFIIFWKDTASTQEKIFEIYFTDNQLENINPAHPISYKNLDSITIQNKRYNSLIEVDASKYYYDNIKYRLFAKNIGLIKYIDRDSNQWELVKYHINQ